MSLIPKDQGSDPSPPETRTILVVEDQESIRTLIVSVLQRAGYSTLQAANGADALDLCALCPRRLDLVITDYSMPRMGGVEFVNGMFTIKPEAQVILLSGKSPDILCKVRGVVVCQKPFTIKGLLAKVAEVLSRAG